MVLAIQKGPVTTIAATYGTIIVADSGKIKSSLNWCAGPGEDVGTEALMARVRAQNTMLRGTLDSLATARSELAVAHADIHALTSIIEALRAQHLGRLVQPRCSPAPRPPLPAPDAGSDARISAAAASGCGGGSGASPAGSSRPEQILAHQVALTFSSSILS